MRILYCIPALYNAGGMERVLTQKVNWLASHTEHEITIITTERTPEGTKDTYFPLDKQVQVVSLNIDFDADYSKPLLTKWFAHMRKMREYERALKRYIRAQEIDLCISLCGKEIAFLHSLPCRSIAELHFAKDQRRHLLEANHRSPFWSLLGYIRTWQLVNAIRPLECLVVLTEADKKDWNKAGCKNVICIPNPCSLDRQELQKSSISSDKNTVLAVGRLHEQKGFDLLLQAWRTIEQRHPDRTLRIVGEGPQRDKLGHMIENTGLRHVLLAGRTKNMANEYLNASLFVLSSRYEGSPLVLSEAMWCGVPCVAFDCPQGPAELLAEGRGWLVPKGDVDALSRQIEYAITHPEEAEQHAQKAQQFAQQTYSEKNIMPKWIELIEHII
ncbi:MAG: glycosyltransferase family 4 protein [Paludibacteraceae bacterium]|nr:glycosyltransferase family 4 protein [Paludibacteraceae bacterium]